MTTYYIEAKMAEQNGKKVAWITSGGPVEPLIAMDVIPVYPENHGAMIGASKMGIDLCQKAEAMGYSSDLCSYARSDISCATINGGPIGGLPKPDMLTMPANTPIIKYKNMCNISILSKLKKTILLLFQYRNVQKLYLGIQ